MFLKSHDRNDAISWCKFMQLNTGVEIFYVSVSPVEGDWWLSSLKVREESGPKKVKRKQQAWEFQKRCYNL